MKQQASTGHQIVLLLGLIIGIPIALFLVFAVMRTVNAPPAGTPATVNGFDSQGGAIDPVNLFQTYQPRGAVAVYERYRWQPRVMNRTVFDEELARLRGQLVV